MNFESFKTELETLAEQFSDFIEMMPEKGDTSADSQKCALRVALNNLEANIMGIEPFDLVDVPADIEHLVEQAERDFKDNPLANVYRVRLRLHDHRNIDCVLVAPGRSSITPEHPALQELDDKDEVAAIEEVQLLHGCDQFVIYSANEAATNDGRGFWNRNIGWTWLADADRFEESELDPRWLPMSLGNDRQYVRYNDATFCA